MTKYIYDGKCKEMPQRQNVEAKNEGHMVILRREGAVAWTYRCHLMAIKVKMTGEIQERVHVTAFLARLIQCHDRRLNEADIVCWHSMTDDDQSDKVRCSPQQTKSNPGERHSYARKS